MILGRAVDADHSFNPSETVAMGISIVVSGFYVVLASKEQPGRCTPFLPSETTEATMSESRR